MEPRQPRLSQARGAGHLVTPRGPQAAPRATQHLAALQDGMQHTQHKCWGGSQVHLFSDVQLERTARPNTGVFRERQACSHRGKARAAAPGLHLTSDQEASVPREPCQSSITTVPSNRDFCPRVTDGEAEAQRVHHVLKVTSGRTQPCTHPIQGLHHLPHKYSHHLCTLGTLTF